MAIIKKILNRFEIYAGAFCQGVMIILLLLQVISRYVFNRAFSWTEELALIFFIVSVYFGATAAVRRNQHLRLSVVLDKLKRKSALKLGIVNNIIFMIFNCIIISGLMTLTTSLFKNGAVTAVTGIPKWIIYAFLPLLFAVMTIRLVQDCIDKFRQIGEAEPTGTETESIE